MGTQGMGCSTAVYGGAICAFLGLACAAAAIILPTVYSSDVSIGMSGGYGSMSGAGYGRRAMAFSHDRRSEMSVNVGLGYLSMYSKVGGETSTESVLSKSCKDEEQPDSWGKCCGALKSGFSMMVIGCVCGLINFAMICSAGLESNNLLASHGKVAMATAGLACVFYMLGLGLPPTLCSSFVADINQSEHIDAQLSISFYLAIAAFILGGPTSYSATHVAVNQHASDQPATVVASIPMQDTAPAAGEPTGEQPPPGGVYMKNGVWMDKDSNPITTQA